MNSQDQSSGSWALRRNEVLEAAAALFAVRGMAGVSMRDIGATCGLHMSTLYHYFPNKVNLYQEACWWACEVASNQVLKSLEGEQPPAKKIEHFVGAVARFFSENGAAAGLLDRELLSTTEGPHTSDFPEVAQQPVLRLAHVLQELAPPILATIEARRLAELVWDIPYGIARYSPGHIRVSSRDRALETEAERTISESWIVVRALLNL
jgi:AcrR family transcriptional regulator